MKNTIKKEIPKFINEEDRLPETIIEEIKLLANKRDVPYQSLMKIFLAERVEQEFQK